VREEKRRERERERGERIESREQRAASRKRDGMCSTVADAPTDSGKSGAVIFCGGTIMYGIEFTTELHVLHWFNMR
jgi:hypothetical protein